MSPVWYILWHFLYIIKLLLLFLFSVFRETALFVTASNVVSAFGRYFENMYYIIQLSPEEEVNIGGYIPRREASRYISTALQRP